ncbi:unnamed protein product, partial [Nesidiocoris tenuis]
MVDDQKEMASHIATQRAFGHLSSHILTRTFKKLFLIMAITSKAFWYSNTNRKSRILPPPGHKIMAGKS